MAQRRVRIPFGLPGLDVLLSGGLPMQTFTECVGDPGVGKTALGLQLLAEAQRRGYHTILGNIEHKIDEDWAEKIGVNWSKLEEMPETALTLEGLLEFFMTDVLERPRKKPIVVLLDSLAALPDIEELEKEELGPRYGRRASYFSDFFRRVMAKLSYRNVQFFGINHLKEKIGDKWKRLDSPGGRAIKYHASTRLKVWSKKIRGSENRVVAQEIGVEVFHSHFTTPFRSTRLRFNFEKGFGLKYGLSEALWQVGRIQNRKRGYFAWKGKKFLGDRAIRTMIRKHPKILEGLLNGEYESTLKEMLKK